jgi:cbb3-type cytochrome oxidase maturation protein
MEALYILLIFSLILGVGFLIAFFWAQKTGQFEDSETPAIRMLFDEVPARAQLHSSDSKKKTGAHHGN